jgi:polyisoprenoid-binding protein YceI
MYRTATNASALIALAFLILANEPVNAQLGTPPETTEGAPASRSVRLALREGSRLWFDGDSNLHDWSCNAPNFTVEVTVDRAGPGGSPTRVEEAVLTIPVAEIECGNGKMNSNLREALEAEDHPHIRFVVDDATFSDPAFEGLFGVVGRGDLTVAGATVQKEIPVSASDTGTGALNVTGRIQMLMTEFGIEPPTALLGLLKTKDEVVVMFDLVLGYAELETMLSGR